MYTLESVAGYIEDVRTLLLDRVPPYRYGDASLLVAFNTALLEGRRLRADLFVFRHGNRVPSYAEVSSDIVPIEEQFRLAFVYGTAAHALMRDQEDIQDARVNLFMGAMMDILIGKQRSPVPGKAGTPDVATKQGMPS